MARTITILRISEPLTGAEVLRPSPLAAQLFALYSEGVRIAAVATGRYRWRSVRAPGFGLTFELQHTDGRPVRAGEFAAEAA